MSEKNNSARALYLECESGISGDMTVAALLDVGASESVLREALDSIAQDGYSICIKRVKKAGIDCLDFDVILDEAHENHDHDMEYLHGHEQHYNEEHSHDHNVHQHDNDEHSHDHNNHHHTHHSHRGMKDIVDIINNTVMTEEAKRLAIRIFDILAKAEAKAHAVPVEDVHFHEVGAIDSIIDVIAVAVCIDNLGIDEVIIPKLMEGRGTVRCQHGILPIPVPAVANIVAEYGINLSFMEHKGEFVTPTGVAIAAALKTSDKLPASFKINKIGVGAGKRNYEQPSILRAMIIESNSDVEADIYKLETNIDDCSGEALGYAMECLLQNGALDVHFHPVFMKKNRPGWQLNVICKKKDIDKLEGIIFKETTTIGIRVIKVERNTLQRRMDTIETPYGKAKVKVCTLDNGEERVYPEYDSVVSICKQQKLSYQEVYNYIYESSNNLGGK